MKDSPLPIPDRTQRQAARQRNKKTLTYVPESFLADRDQELVAAIAEIAVLKAENQILLAKLAKLEGPDWSLRDSITY